MDSDRNSRNFFAGILLLGALFFASVFFGELFAALSSQVAPRPQTGVSAEGWLAFLKAIGAAAVAIVLAKSFMYVNKPAARDQKESKDRQLVVDSVPATPSEIAYHAIVARSDDGSLAKGYVIGFVRRGHKGYTAEPKFGCFIDFKKAQEKAELLNAQLGLSKAKASRMISRWC